MVKQPCSNIIDMQRRIKRRLVFEFIWSESETIVGKQDNLENIHVEPHKLFKGMFTSQSALLGITTV